MKPAVADWQSRVHCVRIEPLSGTIVRLTEYPTDLTMSNGAIYSAEGGYQFSGYGATSSLSPSSIDLSGILDQGISRDDLASGKYDNARVYLFATSFTAPIENQEPLAKFILGKTQITDERYTAELMHLIDALNQTVGRTYSPLCQATLFDQTLDGVILDYFRSRCIGPRAAPDGPSFAAQKVTGTLTSITDRYTFTDSTKGQPADWFAAGAIRFLSGANAGLKPLEIKAFASGGIITTHEAFFYAPQVGDSYEMIPGCRKRLAEDCVTKFANGKNFMGFPHVPAPSQYGQVGRK